MAIRFGLITRVLPLAFGALALFVAGCAPEVGSARWCDAMKDKPRGDWTGNEALEFARHCVLN
jgi:hypothetical protein